MRRVSLLFTFLITWSSTVLFAGEGMWIPMLLKYNEKEMQEMGMKITAEDIYSINRSSLKDAIVMFGNGCTGEIVSDKGLLFTNHHCGYGWIQRHSSVEHDYLTDGFWAMNMGEELPCPGLTVTMLKEMRNVTSEILRGINDEMNEKERDSIIDKNKEELIARTKEETDYEVSIQSFFLGNEYYMLFNEVFKDIRLVGTPPSNIGKFGGDTDNWVWPRHTGDFSVFRIYVGSDGKPAEYAKDNLPYKPAKHLEISLKGAKEGDFAFVFGYPAYTSEYLPAAAVNQEANVTYPIRVDLRGKTLDIYNKYQNQDAKVRIQYASKHAGLANGWKKWMGVTEGINRFKGVERKRIQERAFQDWVLESRSRHNYVDLLRDFQRLYTDKEPYELAYVYLSEAGLRTEIITFAGRFAKLESFTKETDTKTITETIENLKKSSATFFKDYHMPIDKEVALLMFNEYINAQPATFRPSVLNEIKDVDAFVENLFNKSMFASEERTMSFLDGFNIKDIKKLKKDPAYQIYKNMIEFYRGSILPQLNAYDDTIQGKLRVYMRGMMEKDRDRRFYPDANFTLRVTYGKVEGFKPQDAVNYKHYTTLEGIMEKENPEIYDYVVVPRLKELYNAKDYGRYADSDGTMHVAFTSSLHTTGGNSGSPILNAEGQLLGLNFDRCWEGTMSDLIYDPDICRNISVDIRYVLFIIDKLAGAKHLINEMTIVE